MQINSVWNLKRHFQKEASLLLVLPAKSDCSWSNTNNHRVSHPWFLKQWGQFCWLSKILARPFLEPGRPESKFLCDSNAFCMLHLSLCLLRCRFFPTPLKCQTVLKPHLIWLLAPFVSFILFCHCPKARRSLGQWLCLVFGTISFTEHLYVHLWCRITNNKNRTA